MNFLKRFEETANRNAAGIAFTDLNASRKTTYAELSELSGRVAGKLLAAGCKRGDFVMVCVGRRMEYFAAYLGILKAGCAVVLTVPDYPKERIDFIREDSSAVCTITEEFFSDIDSYEPVCSPADDSDPALLLYTSGSTGKPKGILHSVKGISAAVEFLLPTLDGIEPLVSASVTTFSFALNSSDILVMLAKGGEIHILSDEQRRSAKEILSYYISHGITCGVVPSQMLSLLHADDFRPQRILTAGEILSNQYFPGIELVNMYGQSETAAIISTFTVDKCYENTPIGKALPGIEMHILDEKGNELPVGETGEIYIDGPFDVRYFKNPELTAATFIPLPDGRTRVRTGDWGYMLADGNFVYSCRKDWMVKINGQRVETTEVEFAMKKAQGVGNAAVRAFRDENGQTYLAGYYESSAETSEEGIRAFLQSALPAYMVPRFLVHMDKLPLNANGKLDRKALPAPDKSVFREKYTAPRSETEQKLCEAFAASLHCSEIGIDDNFFMLGGDSIQVLHMIDKAGIGCLTPELVFSGKTPRGIAKLCDGKAEPEEQIAHLESIPAVMPLTESQKGVYLECMNDPDSLVYNIPILCRLPQELDTEKFISAVKAAADTHQALFVTIGTPEGVPSMLYSRGTVAIAEKTVELLQDEMRAFIRPFDLENGPLYRFELCHTPEGNVFLLDIHHLVFDGSSVEALLNQIARVYDGGNLPAEALTLFDVSAYERNLKDSKTYADAQAFFREKLGGIDWDSKPVPDVVAENGLTGAVRLTLDAGAQFDAEAVSSFAKRNGITENTLFLTAFAYTLAKMNGTSESAFCTVNSGRHDPRLADSVGMFVRTIPVYTAFDETKPVADLLQSVQDNFFETMRHDCISFGELASEYGVNMDVTFVYQSELSDTVEIGNGFLKVEMLETGESQSDINFMLLRDGGSFRALVHYNRAVFTEAYIRSFASLYLRIVNGLMNAETLADIPLTDSFCWDMLEGFNRTETAWEGDKTIVELFRRQVKKMPDKVCLVYCGTKYTYAEADAISDRLAKNLVRMGIGREKIVGILIPRCEYMLLCSLGVLKAGGAYMPLDPSYPPERLNFMLQDAGASMLIYNPSLAQMIDDSFTGIRLSTDDIPNLPDCQEVLPEPDLQDLFVMLYTSGSTGLPKGVEFSHNNAHTAAEFFRRYFEMDEDTKLASYASYGFDAHVIDMYPPVLAGGELHIIAEDIRLDLPAVQKYFNENGITHCVMTTQVGRQFAQMGGHRTLRHLSVAGEKLTPLAPPDGFKMYNLYGPTEGSVITSYFHMNQLYKDVPIGRPVDNLKVYIVDKKGKLLPMGAVGELWIAGPHVTRGYRNRPEKTAEVYLNNPFPHAKGYERVYRTGDLVRFLGDGNLQFVGRRDAQVKIRGFRVELTEVEEVIRRYPGVKDATVAAFDEANGGKYLCGYVVSDGEISVQAIADFIRAEKPPYMVPAVIMQIDRIPLNQNHKVNKKALPKPERKAEDMTPPQNETQQKVFDLVADVIGHTGFGIYTSLYDAGLTSIGSVKLNVSLAMAFDVPVKISDIKANDTVEKLALFLNAGSAETESFPLQDDYPITETQKGIFVECMANPGTTIYNIPTLFRLGAGVDLTRLKKAVADAVDAHPYVKTVLFTDAEGNVRAKRQDDLPPQVGLYSVDSLPEKDELYKPFELLGKPLYRATLFDTRVGKYLYMDFHHIICDGTGVAVLLQDIDRAYAGEALQREKFSGFEAALLEEKTRSGKAYDDAKAYWKSLLSGNDGTSVILKDPEPGMTGAGCFRRAGETNAQEIKAFCEENGWTLNAFFHGVFAYVLGRFTNRETVNYATIFNGRSDSRFASIISMLVKTIPVSFSLKDDLSVHEYISAVQKQLMDSMANDVCSFAELASDYGIDADLIFNYQGEDFIFDRLCGEEAKLLEMDSDTAKSPLSINVYLENDRFTYTVEYDRASYSSALTSSLLEALMTAVDAFRSEEMLGDVTLLSDQAEQVYAGMNATDTAVREIYCHQLEEFYARTRPEKTAVIANGESITYGELNTSANRVAHRLADLGIGKETIVGLILERSKEVLIAELAILKAGGAFLPMLPSYPDERLDYCLTNAESPFVLTTEKIHAEKTELFSGKTYRALTLEELLSDERTENLNLPVSPDQLAYCIYTSGSTGKPKGVLLEQRNFSNFVQTFDKPSAYYSDPDAGGSCIAMSSISFDMSVTELWMPLCTGNTVCMASEEEYHNPMLLTNLMRANDVRMMCCTPSFLTNMLEAPGFDEVLKRMKNIIVGAEAFPEALYGRLHGIAPDLQIMNGYGPTEASMCCSTKELHSGDRITIGKPIGNMRFYVVDKGGHILPPYAEGELIICGAGVGRGYMKLPEKTSACFYELRGLPAYHSGDRVRLNADGEIEFGGRIDNQVKLRGFRVELDEIEKVICEYEGVQQSKVLVRNNGSEDYLAGFFTANVPVDTESLTAFMKTRLTYYMVPAVLMQLTKMPLTANGKIDKNGFPETKQNTRKSGGKKAAKKSLEQRLCEIFESVLGTEGVYADDNFFSLGGTSLSASKVTMLLMSDGIEVKYGDIFDHPTPEELAQFIEDRDRKSAPQEGNTASPDTNTTRKALEKNLVRYAPEVKREPLGNVLLTGAVGFLGIHILKELLDLEEGHIYCLVRKGSYDSSESRLKTMLFYYFSDGFDEALENRITLLDADITDAKLDEVLADVPFDTVINCAACVKHFADDDSIERINVKGVENLIAVCKKRDKKLIQISTTSVPGVHTKESYEKHVRMHENELFVINDMDNKYGISKYHAELRMFDAIEEGMRGKVIRAGNLMGRYSDGEFQANLETNMFLSGMRGFATMGMYPISHMTDPMRFSPVDCTARAVVMLSGTNDQFTAFNCDNRYGFDEMKIIDACNRNGITILPADDDMYYEEYRKKLGDARVNSRLNGLAAYDLPDVHSVETDNLFTTNILYRIGFSWPLVDETYLDRAINSIMTLDYFDYDETEEEDG